MQTALHIHVLNSGGPGSSVGIATGYGLDGSGIERRWGRNFPHLSRPALGPIQPPVQWVPGLSRGGKERPGRDADPSPPSSAVSHEKVELYLYSPYGPYGPYRASVPVQGSTLPYLLLNSEAVLLLTLNDTQPVDHETISNSYEEHLSHTLFTYLNYPSGAHTRVV